MNDVTAPRISVVVPAFNGEPFIASSIESVLEQTYPNVEFVIVDDGSTDRTIDVVQGFDPDVRLVVQSNAGPGAARNRGAAETTGPLLAFLDQDDTWHPERLQRMTAAMARDGASAVLCATRALGENPPMGRLVRMDPPSPSIESLLLWQGRVVSCGSNLLIERGTFRSLGGFDASLGPVTDWELLVRLVTEGVRLAYLDEPLVDYRWHEGNATHDRSEVERALARAYSSILARNAGDLQISSRQAIGGMHKMLAIAALRMGDRRGALRHGAQAAWRNPGGMAISARRALARRLRRARAS